MTISLLFDPILVKVCDKACACPNVAQEAGTNCNDVLIAFLICTAFAIVAIVGICRYFSWKRQEVTNIVFKEEKEHQWVVEDVERKTRNDLIEKHLDALKWQAQTQDAGGKATGFKASDTEDFKAYKEALDDYINL